jgi:hypothetical protein
MITDEDRSMDDDEIEQESKENLKPIAQKP